MKKIKENEKKLICDDYNSGLSITNISEKYNVCTWSIQNVLKKQNIDRRIRKYKCNENYFETIDSSDKAYWLGILFADGYVRQRRQCDNKHKQGGIVGIGLKECDGYLLEKLIKDIDSNYTLKKSYKDNKIYFKLEINSSKMTKDLISHGCVLRKSLILEPPINLPNDLISHFIRGYFDGDGSVGIYGGRIKFSILGTKKVLEWIRNYFYSSGIESYPKVSKKNNIHSIQYNKQNDIDKIKNIIYYLANDHFLIRKKEKFI